MSFINTLQSIAKGATVGVLAVTALPIFGAVGVVTATGVVVGSIVGAAAALVDEIEKNK